MACGRGDTRSTRIRHGWHWSLFVVWAITVSAGPIIFVVDLLDGSRAWLLGLAIYGVTLLTMAIDWLVLRRVRRTRGWTR